MISARAVSPIPAMNVTLFNSTMHLRPLRSWRFSLHRELSSAAHGPTKRPSRDHLCSSGKSVMVILSTAVSLLPVTRCRSKAPRTNAFTVGTFLFTSDREHVFYHTQPISRITQMLEDRRNTETTTRHGSECRNA